MIASRPEQVSFFEVIAFPARVGVRILVAARAVAAVLFCIRSSGWNVYGYRNAVGRMDAFGCRAAVSFCDTPSGETVAEYAAGCASGACKRRSPAIGDCAGRMDNGAHTAADQARYAAGRDPERGKHPDRHPDRGRHAGSRNLRRRRWMFLCSRRARIPLQRG